MNKYECGYFPNIGILKVELTEEQLKPIKDEIVKVQNNMSLYTKTNSKLAGNIEHEYKLEKSNTYIEQLLSPYIDSYDKQFKYLDSINILSKSLPLRLDEYAWVNFMKKHEFNPSHTHVGVLSFVIWIDIPYSIEDEMKQNYCKSSNLTVPGHFEFLYTTALGVIEPYHIPADKTYNNTLLIFPSKLRHGVYPFTTSDKYRISVSGNYKFIV